MKFIKVDNYEKLSHIAANIISAQIISKPDTVLGLATGSTPIGTYKKLIERCESGDVDFTDVTSYNLDEYVGLDGTHDQSYRYFMNTQLFDHINIDKARTFIPNGCTNNPEEEGKNYDEMIKKAGGIDLQLLGIGVDGHIGFNEPDDCFVSSTHIVDLHESTIKANSRFFGDESLVPTKAITMGMLSIMQAKKVLLIANGENKKEILEKAFFGPVTPLVPASILQLHSDVTVIYSEK